MNRSTTNIAHIPEALKLARQDAINTMCVGEFNTEFHRVLANIRLDYEEGRISKEDYEKLIAQYAK